MCLTNDAEPGCAAAPLPVVPTRRVILAIRVVVAVLSAAELVAPEQSSARRANEERQEEVADLPAAQRLE